MIEEELLGIALFMLCNDAKLVSKYTPRTDGGLQMGRRSTSSMFLWLLLDVR